MLSRTGVPFCVGFNRRFDPTHRALHDAIRAGEIGRPEMLILSSSDPEISPPDAVAASADHAHANLFAEKRFPSAKDCRTCHLELPEPPGN